MHDLSFEIKNLGVIREGRFTQKPLTIFCGPNNSGKTSAMYSLYQCHCMAADFAESVEPENRELYVLNRHIKRVLHNVFNAHPEFLDDATFRLVEIPKQRFENLLRDKKKVFLVPAERNGLHLVYRELRTVRGALLHPAPKEHVVDLSELSRDVTRSRLALPVAKYIDWLNRLEERPRRTPSEFHSFAEQIKRNFLDGVYRVERSTGNVTFKPYRKRGTRKGIKAMGLHMTSSTVRCLFGLWFYLENQARSGDLLMIDEPELNIHPENQLRMARFLARLVNAGLNVVISTHSDYMIREFNTLLMLNEDKSGALKREYGYDNEEVLRPEHLGAYLFDKQTIRPFRLTSDDGIYATTFADATRTLNSANDSIHFALQKQRMARH